jgi:hypothetical protein
MRLVLVLTLGLISGAVIASIFLGQGPEPDEETEIARLRSVIDLERQARLGLLEQVRQLEARFAEGEGAETSDAAAAASANLSDDAVSAPRNGTATVAEGSSRARDDRWFVGDRLLDLGMRQSEVERIQQRWEKSVMDRLYLEDSKLRDKKLSDAELARARIEINRAMREDLGDEAYDAMLYSTQRKNRVIMTDILDDSPARAAGLLSGDEVISYDYERIFNPFVLKHWTKQGQLGDWTELRVLRGGELLRIYVPRGPLGVRLEHELREPFLP